MSEQAETPQTPQTPQTPPAAGSAARRTIVAAAGTAGLATVLAACGGSSGGGAAKAGSPSSQPSGGGSESGASGGGVVLARTSDIPEGGGTVFPKQKVVVTQPTAGDFKCFSAVCTHAGCLVIQVSDGTIDCPCHGSKFHVADGSVAHGPANTPLPAKQVSVKNGSITLD